VTIDVLFAGIAVGEFDAALGWYARLLGRPADIMVKDDEVMWQISQGGWLYVVCDPSRAGRALVALAVADLDEVLTEVAGRGLTSAPVEAMPGAGRKASFTDPEGNTISFIQVEQSGG
jgi:predicted enzyme related to lactoylglutathione lyase